MQQTLPACLLRASLLAFFVIVIAAFPAAAASDRSTSSAERWRSMDTCSKDAFKQFPDYTTEAAAKRDASVNECLKSKNLPPRTPMAPHQAATAPQ